MTKLNAFEAYVIREALILYKEKAALEINAAIKADKQPIMTIGFINQQVDELNEKLFTLTKKEKA
jgi:hypothetical protein